MSLVDITRKTITSSPGRTEWILMMPYGSYIHPLHSTPLLTAGYRELAALIGQVKPPTATREDIEKSGLQIIKPREIPQYAAEGRVAFNCIDRVSLGLPPPLTFSFPLTHALVSGVFGRLRT